MQILFNLVDTLGKNDEIIFAYIENKLTERYDDIHLYVVFKNDDIERYYTFIKNYLEKEMFLILWTKKENEFHFVSEEGLSLYIHFDKAIFNFSNRIVLYNKDLIDFNSLKFSIDNREIFSNAVSSIQTIIDELHSYIQAINKQDLVMAINYLNSCTKSLFTFLNCIVLLNPMNHSSRTLLEKMNKEDSIKYQKIISLLKIDTMKDCAFLIVWFVDSIISRLPINLAKEINIDYFLYVKKMIAKN